MTAGTVPLRGPPAVKKNSSIIYLREKHSKQNICIIKPYTQFVLRFFLQNIKKTICIENIGFLGVLQKIYLLQFHRQNKIDNCISFPKPQSRASQAAFFKFLKNKIQQSIFKNYCPPFVFLCIFFNVFVFSKIVCLLGSKACNSL